MFYPFGGSGKVETFLRRISFEQLWCFLWWSSCWSTARSLLQKLQGAAPKGSDPLRLLLDEEAAEGTSKERGFTKEDRGSLRKCIEEELKDFSLHFAGSDFWCGVSLERYFPQVGFSPQDTRIFFVLTLKHRRSGVHHGGSSGRRLASG